jgi:hypothetical protein
MTSAAILRRAGLLVAATVLLAGCFRIESSFDIGDDGTVDVDLVAAVDVGQLRDLADTLGQDVPDLTDLSGEDLVQQFGEGLGLDPCADLARGLSGYDVTTNEIDEGDERGVECSIEDVPIDELTNLGGASSLAITQDGETTTFDLRLEGVSELTAASQDLPLPMFDIEDLFDIRFSASAPGSLEESNASETNGATATWVVTPDADFVTGDAATMSATWGPESSSGSGWLIALVVALVVIGLVVLAGVLLLPRLRPRPDVYAEERATVEPPFPSSAPGGSAPPDAGGLPPAPPPPESGAPSGPTPAPPAGPATTPSPAPPPPDGSDGSDGGPSPGDPLPPPRPD